MAILKTRGYQLLGVFHMLFEEFLFLDLPCAKKAYILKNLGKIEGSILQGSTEKIQLGAIIGTVRYAIDVVQ